jgi:hypothetical protein
MHRFQRTVWLALIVAVVCTASMLGTSLSQDRQRNPDHSEVGRFQMVETAKGTRVFDTVTGRSWLQSWVTNFTDGTGDERWVEKPAPWAKPSPRN